MEMISALIEAPTADKIDDLLNASENFISQLYMQKEDWPNTFMHDSELVWREGKQPVDEL